jgi:RNA polymerase sigma factor (sigma-70 family)
MANNTLRPLINHIRRAAAPAGAGGPTDRELLARYARHRDETAFAALVRRHGRLVLAACRQVLADEADVEDAFQATFIVLLRKASRVRWRDAIGGWLFGVAHRVAVKARCAAARRRECERRACGRRPEASESPDLSWREACAILHEELDRLPDRHRLPLLLCYLDGRSREEAAHALGRPLNAVKWQLERGRNRLRARLARRGVALTAGLFAAATANAATAMPAAWLVGAVRAALRSTASAPVAGLARQVLRMSLAPKLSLIGLALIASLGTGLSLSARWSPAGAPAADPPAPPAAAPDAPPRGLNVRIVGPDGRPKPGARLYLPRLLKFPPRSPEDFEFAERGTADADGQFHLALTLAETVGPMRLTLVARAEGLACDWVEIDRKAPKGDLTLRLVPDLPIEGRILDTEGRPVAGARVDVHTLYTSLEGRIDSFLAAWPQSWQSAPQQLLKRAYGPLNRAFPTVTTGADGRFRITGVGTERVALLEVGGPTIARASVWVVARAGFDGRTINRAAAAAMPAEMQRETDPRLYGPTFDYVAAAGKTVEGVVTEATTGRPLAGVVVSTLAGYGAQIDAVTDERGRYRLTGVPKQRDYLLVMEPPAGGSYLRAGARPADTPGLQPVRADAVLARGVVVTGRLIDRATGRPLSGNVRFSALPENHFAAKPGHDSHQYEHLSTPVGDDGRFRLVVIPGPGVLMAQVYTPREGPDGPAVSPFRQADFTAEERRRVPVTETGDGDRHFTAAGPVLEFLTHLHAVKLLDLAEGADAVTCDLTVERGKTLPIRVEDPDGRPLAGATVAGLADAASAVHTLPAAEGTVYALSPARPRQLVFLHAQRGLAGAITLPGEKPAPVTVRLDAAGAVTGRVLDREGKPVVGATVRISAPNARAVNELYRHLTEGRDPPRTDADGRFRLGGIVPDQAFTLQIRTGATLLIGQPRIGERRVRPGETLDLGDVRTEPRRQ